MSELAERGVCEVQEFVKKSKLIYMVYDFCAHFNELSVLLELVLCGYHLVLLISFFLISLVYKCFKKDNSSSSTWVPICTM